MNLVVDQKQFVGYNCIEMPTLEAPNKPKKYEVVEYPVQKVDNLEQKRQESQALFETLSLEDREKYYEAYAEFVQKANALGYDVSKYDIFFAHLDNSDAAFAISDIGQNYIAMNPSIVSKYNKLIIIKTLFHELVGHCMTSKNLSKFSNETSVRIRGLQFRNDRDIAPAPKISKENISVIANKLNSGTNKEVLSKQEELIITALVEVTGVSNRVALIDAINKYYDDQKNFISRANRFLNNTKNIGYKLNEGVAEYIAVNMTTTDIDERFDLIEESTYLEYILPLVDLGSHLLELNSANLQAWDDCLYDARLTGQPYKIIKFLKDKTGITITPKDLFDLDFSKILSVDEKK
jgi:hypothetical protein